MAKKALILTVVLVSLLALASILFLVQLTRTRSAKAQTEGAAKTALSNNPPTLPPPDPNFSLAKNSSAPTGPGGMSAMMRKMMDDPAMREMMRSQQKTVMSQMYAPLFKDLQLTPEQRGKFLNLLVDNAMSSVADAGNVMQGQGADRTEALKSIQDRQKEMNDGMKELLGAEKFPRFEEYQKTLGERTQLDTFRQELADSESPLQEAQAAQLMAILTEEKAKVPAVLTGGSEAVGANLSALSSPETMNQHFQWQEDVNRRVLARAKEALNPQQLSAYGAFLRQQLDRQKLGIKMAQDLFGAPRTGAEGAPARGVDVIPVPAKP
jgi:hypothetical protein